MLHIILGLVMETKKKKKTLKVLFYILYNIAKLEDVERNKLTLLFIFKKRYNQTYN